MKYHIVQVGEDINKICDIYGIEKKTLEKLNPTINSRNLIVGEKLRVIYERLLNTKNLKNAKKNKKKTTKKTKI